MRIRRLIACTVATLLLAQQAAFAADRPASALGTAGRQVQEMPYPSIWRVLLGFVFTVALAVAAAWVLRRVWPFMGQKRSPARHIRIIDRSVVSAALTVHLCEVDGARFVIAEGRGGTAVVPLAGTTPPADGGVSQ